MKELEIVVKQERGTIATNFDLIEESLNNQMEIYKGLEVTEDNKVERKKDVSTLRKMVKAVNDKRIEVKNECLKPYLEFEESVKRLVGIIETPINLLDNQVKELEEKQRLAKKAEIKKIYEEYFAELDNVTLSQIYDAKWENVATSMKSIKEDIKKKADEIGQAVNIILGMKSDKSNEALEMYWDELDLTKAILMINTYEDNKKKILAQQEEKQRKEREREIEAERERVRNEERARIREEEKIREEERQKALAEEERIREEERTKTIELERQKTLTERETLEQTIREEERQKVNIEQEEKEQAILYSMAIHKQVNAENNVIVTYNVIAAAEEHAQIEMYLQSIGVDYERVE